MASALATRVSDEYNDAISGKLMACPFFMPTAKYDGGGWIHPARLPLGAGWRGQCSAPGHEGSEPTEEEVRDFCNLGYASRCSRLPKERVADAVRFSITRDRGNQLTLCFVRELAHRPVDHGILEYDSALGQWISSHPDFRIQKMADCYLQSYLMRRTQPGASGSSTSTNS
jgi:hypothetical protein